MVKKIFVDRSDCNSLIGTFLDESHYDLLIEEDVDVYERISGVSGDSDSESEERVVLKFRKNFFSKEQQAEAYAGLREAATPTNNRGSAAGTVRTGKNGNREWVTVYEERVLRFFTKPYTTITGEDPIEELRANKQSMLDPSSAFNTVWLSSKPLDFEAWIDATRKLTPAEQKKAAKEVIDTNISGTTYANEVYSGIAGAFGRVPRVPYGRLAAYNERSPENYKRAIPFIRTLDAAFSELLPKRYSAQKKFVSDIDQNFRISDTVFTTLTINKTFRTAAHLDAGDFGPGFSNLLVLSNDGNYTGGYLVCPEFRAAVNVRPGDLLLIANHTAIHGNTPIVLGSESSERISIVAYAREDLAQLGTWEYEQTRKKYVEACRDNKEHPHWWDRFSGVYPGQWQSKEWFDYLVKELGEEKARKNDPAIFEIHDKTSLESFFG